MAAPLNTITGHRKIFGAQTYLWLLPFFLLFLSAHALFAQSPGKINYQAVAREAETGAELANQSVYVVCKIRRGGPQGQIVYQEEHPNTRTNAFGLFNIQIGSGEILTGNFNSIGWGESGFWLEIDMDAGSGLETIGAMEFVSVPYALHAESADNVDDADANPENELIDGIEFNSENYTLTVFEAGAEHSADLSDLLGVETAEIDNIEFDEDSYELRITERGVLYTADLTLLAADGDETNELIDGVSFNPLTYVLSIQEGGESFEVDLGSLSNAGNNDNDVSNELIDNFVFDDANSTLTISEAGESFSVNLSDLIDDADADSTNELVTNFDFDNGSGTLSLSDAGGTRSVDLTGLSEDADSDPTNELITDVDFDEVTSVLTITDDGNSFSIDLTGLIDDADSDPSNELVNNFSFDTGTNVLSLTDAGGTQTIDLTGLSADADADPTNELITNVSFNDATSILSITDDGNTYDVDLTDLIDDADSDPTNELITNVSFDDATSTLSITDDGNTYDVDLADLIDDADSNPLNELVSSVQFNDLTNFLTLTDAGGSYDVDLNSLVKDEDSDETNELITDFDFDDASSTLTISEGGADFTLNLSDLINDADADPTNELQTLAEVLSHNGVDGSDAGSQRIRNLANPSSSQDAATKNYVDGKSLEGDVEGTIGANVVSALQGVPVSDLTPTDGQVLRYDSGDGKWTPQTVTAESNVEERFYAVDPSDFVGVRSDDDAEKYNIAIFEDDISFVTIIKRDKGDEIMAPIHLPHNAKLVDLDIIFKKMGLFYDFEMVLQRKNMYSGGTDNIFYWNSYMVIPGSGMRTRTQDLSGLADQLRTIDNSQYSYRLLIKFDNLSDFDEADDVQVMLYNARIKYEN